MVVSLLRLLSKEIPNVYLKVIIEEKHWRFQNFNFLGLSPGQFWGAHEDFIELKTFLLQLKNQRSGEQNCGCLFYYFNFESNYDILKPKSPCILLNKNINFNKNETKSKLENNTRSFIETNLLLKLIYESQIKSKTMKSSRPEVFCAKGILRNFAKFTGKHLWQSLFL